MKRILITSTFLVAILTGCQSQVEYKGASTTIQRDPDTVKVIIEPVQPTEKGAR
jgi:hypothetical protein